MKKALLLGILAVATLFAASCQRELAPVEGEGLSTVTFNVSVPALATKAYSDGKTATTLQYAVYKVAGEQLTLLPNLTVINGEIDKTATVDLQLTTGNTYSVIFWAAEEDAPYTVDFANKTMTVDYTNVVSNDENLDAFYKYHTFTVSGAQTETVELKRPFAQLNIGTADYEASEKAGYIPTKSSVTVENVYETLNLATGEVSDEVEVVFAENAIPSDQTFPVEGNDYLAMNYLLVGAQKEVVDLTFTYTDGSNAKTRTVGSVPVQRNYRTNIYGNILTSDVDVNVDIEPDFDEPSHDNEHDYYISEGKYYITSANGLRWFAEQVNNHELQNATVILDSDIDLAVATRSTGAAANWTPIGLGTNLSAGDTFRGTFDGAGHTIKNMVVEQGAVAGLFGYVYGATIKNVTIEDATIRSNHYAGGVVAWVLNTKGNIQIPFILENCHVKNSTITSAAEEVNGEWDNGDKVGGLVGYACFADGNYAANDGAKISGCSVENTTIKAYRDFGGLVGYASYVALENCTTENVTLEQDLAHDYKDTTPDTFGLTIGQNAGNNTVNGNAYFADGVCKDADGVYYIYNAEGLVWFAKEVNKHSNYERPFNGETLKLANDINLGGMEWTPIGDYRFSANRFCGTFDGQNHTISNFKITKKTDKSDSNKSSYGFFGNVEGTVKNLTVAKATVSSYAYTGALVGRLNSGLLENCHVVECAVSNSYWQGGILIGQVNGGTVKNCTVENSSITSKSGIGAISGPVTNESENDIVFENCAVENCTINQSGSFGGAYDNYFGTMFGYLEATGDKCIRVNNCTATNTTVKDESNAMFTGDIDGNIYVNGGLTVATAEALKAALQDGGDYTLVSDIALSESISVSNASFTLDGNGYTVTMTENATNTYALFDITGGKATLKNIKFDGIKEGAVVRTVGVEFTASNVTAQNGSHTQVQGIFRLLGKSTISGCTFKNNTCSMVVTLNFDGANNDPQVVENCVFENNTCNGTAALYYVDGAGATVNGNKFVGNTVNETAAHNAATVYMGFTENNVITNNIFQNNTVTAGTSKRVAGGLMIGYEAVITGNAFVGNTVNATNAKGNDVCASVYYTDINLSGNYWGGNAPVQDDDYFVEYPDRHAVIINDYLTTYNM